MEKLLIYVHFCKVKALIRINSLAVNSTFTLVVEVFFSLWKLRNVKVQRK